MTSLAWQVPPVVIAIFVAMVVAMVVAIVYFSSRPDTRQRRPRNEPTSGAELIDRLQQTLGISIVVESVEASEPPGELPRSAESAEPDVAARTDVPHTIHATLMFGRYTTPVVATGPTESDAWAELARMAVAWRNSDYQHIQMWPGGA